MPLKVKKSGAYADPVAVKIKLSGAYQAVQGIYCKVAGAYQSVLGGAVFDPVSLFASGEKGIVLDPSNIATLFQDSAGTVPVTAYGDPVGKIADLSGNNAHLTQATAGTRPIYTDNGHKALTFYNHALASAAVNFSATDKITAVVSIRFNSTANIGVAVELGNIVSINGSFALYAPGIANSLGHVSYIRGTAFGGVKQTTAPTNINTDALSAIFDIAGAAIQDEIKLRNNGVLEATTVDSVGPSGTGNFGNQPIYIGKRTGALNPSKMQIGRCIIIGRTLTAPELAAAETWVVADSGPIIAAVGDSVVTTNASYSSILSYINCKARMMAVAGQTIAQQKTVWQARGDKASFQAVAVQVGLNDLAPAEAASVAIARLQDLINTINADVSVPVFIGTLTPCKAQLISIYGAVDGVTSYNKWLAMNEAISGAGATPITGVDYRMTSHTAALDDGSGNLAAAYQADLIHPNDPGRMIIARSWALSFKSAGLIA